MVEIDKNIYRINKLVALLHKNIYWNNRALIFLHKVLVIKTLDHVLSLLYEWKTPRIENLKKI